MQAVFPFFAFLGQGVPENVQTLCGCDKSGLPKAYNCETDLCPAKTGRLNSAGRSQKSDDYPKLLMPTPYSLDTMPHSD
jgi:hypothetical protein